MPETFKNYVAGQWIDCRSRKTFDHVNPANNGEIVGRFQASGAEDVHAACDAAERAWPQWAQVPAPKRGEYLFKAADLLEQRLAKLAEDMTREEGKTLPESKAEVKRAISIFRYYAGEGARMFSYQIPSERESVFAYTLRKPLGVFGLVTPWNFPSAIPAWQLAPALVAGDTVVLKPASQAPLSAWRLVEALHEAGIPAGVLNLVTGSGTTAGNALADHPAVRGISFTGSNTVGNKLYDKLAAKRLRIQLEMGGKNPTIVLKDADIDNAVEILVNGAFFSTGQKCTSCSRAIIEQPIYDKLMEKLIARTRKLRVGNGMEAGVDVGPAVSEHQLETDLKYIELARKEGAELVCGGRRITGGQYDKGYFVEPTIFTGVKPEMRIAQEEVFGPVLAVLVADSFAEAMQVANKAKFGLSASIVTRDLSRAHEFINTIEAGLIVVNLPTAGVEYQLPFGGTKASSFGQREQGPTALDFYTETRTVYMRY
ncbi:MAG: aldehyde dehydrogenase family protein [Deltaproteobacteria bacterium]|nr:aldehyde dehydrogenase family protein [Deltaproteobacteria bacterium]